MSREISLSDSSCAIILTPDPHTFSNYTAIEIKHLHIDLAVDFDRQVLSGKVELNLRRKDTHAPLILDTRSLKIEDVYLGADRAEGQWSFGEEDVILGKALTIKLRPEDDKVEIAYSTHANASGLQWLTPLQTLGGKKPYLFSVSEAIHARSWMPIQDTPASRFTYSARISVPPQLQLLALMSAKNPKKRNLKTGVYRFKMNRPIPAYLISLTVADLRFRPLGPTNGIYGEKEIVDIASWEFADTEKMISAAEQIAGPYTDLWDRFDLLIMPPSFPYGGMENPTLTYVSPSVIAQDRSLVSIIAHELAHSWSGNLVTNATWNQFFLNEGLTRYFEFLIMESIDGNRRNADMNRVLSYQRLKEHLNAVDPLDPDTRLVMDLSNRDPELSVGAIAYEKGYLFFQSLEDVLGRKAFLEFLRSYLKTFSFQSVTADKLIAHLQAKVIQGDKELESRLNLDEWLYKPGLPKAHPVIRSEEFEKVSTQLSRFIKSHDAEEIDTQGWNTLHWVAFLKSLPLHIGKPALVGLDKKFGFTQIKNAEILSPWFVLAVENSYSETYPSIKSFLLEAGRIKLIKPVYVALTHTPESLQWAREVFANAKPRYHPATQSVISAILK